MVEVKKRNGEIMPFQSRKIYDAIKAAFDDIQQGVDIAGELDGIVDEVVAQLDGVESPIDIELIQDTVEDTLIRCGYGNVAKQYIKYRYEHGKQREAEKRFEQLINAKLRGSNIQNQNANVDEMSFGGRIGEASNELMKKLALENYVSPMARKNHEGNMVYIHKNIVA